MELIIIIIAILIFALYFLFEGMRWEKLTNKEKEEENMKQKDPVVY